MYVKKQSSRRGWRDFQSLYKAMLLRTFRMKIKLLASFELCLKEHYSRCQNRV